MVIFTILGRFGGPLGRWALTWGLPRRLHMVPNFSLLVHTSFLYNWIIFRHKSSYKHRKISCSVKIILKTSFLSDFDPFMGSQQSLCTLKAKYCLQMYNRIIISNFPRNLIIISQFLSFFSLFFQFFKFWSFLGHLLTPQTPGVPKLFYYGAGFIPGVPEMSASFKKLLLDNFFSCQ